MVLLLCTTATAQEKPKAPAPTAEQQKLLKDALDASNKAQVELQTAQQKAELLRQHLFTLLFQVQAELQLKPSEWSVTVSPEGVIGFERIATPITTAKTEVIMPAKKSP